MTAFRDHFKTAALALHDRLERQSIRRIDMRATPEMRNVMMYAQESGEPDPILFSGAIRDHRLGHAPADYDVLCRMWNIVNRGYYETLLFWENENLSEEEQASRNYLCKRMIRDQLSRLHWEVIDIDDLQYYKGQQTWSAMVEAPFGKVHVILDLSDTLDLERFILNRPAPISAAVMTKDGEFYGHPLFANHCDNLVYSPRRDDFDEAACFKFESLAGRNPGLQLIMREDLPFKYNRPSEEGCAYANGAHYAAGILRKTLD